MANDAWKDIFRKIIFNRCSNGIWSNGTKTTYDVINPLLEIDQFGQWEKDLLFGHLRIMLNTKNNEPFPKYWKVDDKTVKLFIGNSNFRQFLM